MENKDGILTFRSSNWRRYQARTVDSMRLHKTLNSCLSSGPAIQYFQSDKARLQSMPCRSMDKEENYLHHVNNYPFPAIPIFSIYVSPFTCTTIVCGKFQYQSCKIIVFLPFSLSCSQEKNSLPKSQATNLQAWFILDKGKTCKITQSLDEFCLGNGNHTLPVNLQNVFPFLHHFRSP